MQAKQELSRAVAAPLTDGIARQPPGAVVVASGTSCRHQIAHLSPAQPQHMAEVLAGALAVAGGSNKSV